MPRLIITFSGRVAAGKTTLATRLADRDDSHLVRTRRILEDRYHGYPPARRRLQELGRQLDQETEGSWVARALVEDAASLPSEAVLVVDSVRIGEQIASIAHEFECPVLHIHLRAPRRTLSRRYAARAKALGDLELPTYEEVATDPTESKVVDLAKNAQVRINTLLPRDFVYAFAVVAIWRRSFARVAYALVRSLMLGVFLLAVPALALVLMPAALVGEGIGWVTAPILVGWTITPFVLLLVVVATTIGAMVMNASERDASDFSRWEADDSWLAAPEELEYRA